MWSAATSRVTKLCDLGPEDTVTSVSWTQRGNHLAVGTNKGEVPGGTENGGEELPTNHNGGGGERLGLGGGFINIFFFTQYLGKIPILTHIFQMGWNHQLVEDQGVALTAGNQSGFTGVKNSPRITGVVGPVTWSSHRYQ